MYCFDCSLLPSNGCRKGIIAADKNEIKKNNRILINIFIIFILIKLLKYFGLSLNEHEIRMISFYFQDLIFLTSSSSLLSPLDFNFLSDGLDCKSLSLSIALLKVSQNPPIIHGAITSSAISVANSR